MFYMQYLSSLCQRRQWSEPYYQTYASRSGVKCVVRVNHREYHSDNVYANDTLATENAAMRAYLICRNFSVNDGRCPSGKDVGGVLQGLPVAIGTGRRGTTSTSGSEDISDAGSSFGTRSGGSSPGSSEFPVSYRGDRGSGSSRRESGSSRHSGYSGSRRR